MVVDCNYSYGLLSSMVLFILKKTKLGNEKLITMVKSYVFYYTASISVFGLTYVFFSLIRVVVDTNVLSGRSITRSQPFIYLKVRPFLIHIIITFYPRCMQLIFLTSFSF